MPELSLMMLDEGYEQGIRCRFINEWFKIDSNISSKEKLLAEIEMNKLDVIMMDLDLYGIIDEIETLKKLRTQ